MQTGFIALCRPWFWMILLVAGGLTLHASDGWSADGAYVGMELGASVPANDNYRAHAEAGIMGSPFVGYMFNDYIGLQGNLSITGQEPDNRCSGCGPGHTDVARGLARENQWTSLLGYTAGPRFQVPFGENVELYALLEGGGFTGLSGRLRQTSPGFFAGGGLDYYLTDHFAVGAFGRWNRAYQAPRPTFLSGLIAEDQGPKDAQWAVGGITLKYRFNEPDTTAAAPPPPPPVAEAPPPPPPPAKKKIILRGVNFDFDKATIRRDAAQILNEAASTLKQEGEPPVVVVGHTDGIGTDEYNQRLSERRADAVKTYLAKKGIPAPKLSIKGLGESQPVASNDSEDGRAQNRRVELLVE